MANGTIQITPEMLKGKAGELRGMRGEHDDVMIRIRNLVNGLNDQWKGEAQTAYVQQFEGMQQTFTNFSELLENFAKLMDTSAQRLEESDRNMAGDITKSFS